MEELERGLGEFGLDLTAVQIDQFKRYETLLLDWNQRLNLTAVRTAEGIRTRHFLDSLTPTLVTGDLSGRRLVDVGSGAGFPGLPLKLVYPQLVLTLVESVAKKAAFLEAAVAELGLADVQVITARAEDVGQQVGQRESYDWAVARAVAPLAALLEYLLPLCRVDGAALAQKGPGAAAELAAAQHASAVLGGDTGTLTPVNVPGQEQASYLVTVRKQRPTPADYPRRAGLPAKKPL